MKGETKHVYAINTKETNSKDPEKGSIFEQYNKSESIISSTSCVSDTCGSALSGSEDKAPQLNIREKEPHKQREAVIRPQQAGKIDFKSLHNRPKFSNDVSWTNSRSSPLSPTGKSRGKDKNKRSGKGDRTQQQLCRLSIPVSRPNPTIGIAYPQQKVTPNKKSEVNQGSISGSYRFHGPSLSEREAELQQADHSFNRCFQESSSSLTSTSYTSQTVSVSRSHPGLKLQPQLGNPHETASSNGQLHFLEFQPNGNSWHTSEKTFSGGNGYGVSNQKLCFSENKKSDPHCFGSIPFQYPFEALQETVGNTFSNDAGSQDFTDVSLALNQVAHNTFVFQSSSREGPEDSQNNGPYNNVLSDNRTYVLPSKQTQYLHVQQDAQHSPTPSSCFTGRNEQSSDHNGAISSSGAITSSGAIDQTQSTFQENQSVFNTSEFHLHSNSLPLLGNKRQPLAKDIVSSQRLLTPGNALRRNIPQTSLNQVHFPSKVCNSGNTVSTHFDKINSRLPQNWDTGSKNFPIVDQNTVPFSSSSGNIVPYQCQKSVDQRQSLKNDRILWQQGHSMSPMPTQNHTELSRQTGNQKVPYLVSGSEWRNNGIQQNIPPGYQSKKHQTLEVISLQRADGVRQGYNAGNTVLFDNLKDANSQMCNSRNKGVLYGTSQQIQTTLSSRNNANQQLSAVNLAAVSPCESPLPSPVNNPVVGSACSSLSSMSSSPVNPSSDDNQRPSTLTSSPYFHQTCHPVEGKPFHITDAISSNSLLYRTTDSMKQFSYLSEVSKEEHLFKHLHENQYHKQSNDLSKVCMESFETETPPPPPYSSNHLLASSLSSANLDQLDVLLTCKQCDQNYSNLTSFLEHRQYCSMNSIAQSEIKDSMRGTEVRKQVVDPIKSSHSTPGLTHSKGPIDFQQQVTVFNKAVDFLIEGDAKGDNKDDPIKVNIFHSITSNPVPLSACDTLEMDEAKLDSLITEALNGLEFQVDNAEIDSSFIDVFVDDDPSTDKATGCGQTYKTKESLEHKTKQKSVEEQKHQYVYKDNSDTEQSCKSRNLVRQQTEQKDLESDYPYHFDTEKIHGKNRMPQIPEEHELLKGGKTESILKSDLKRKIKINKNDQEIPEDNNTKLHETQHKRLPDFSTFENQKIQRLCNRDVKKKKSYNGTWSKELIHKIVQQKNKLHKLHVKSNKNIQFSLVTERLSPATKSHPFGEYDYISDSEDDTFTASLQAKKTPNGKLKYTFNRDPHRKGGKTKGKDTIWRVGEATRFQLKNKDLTSLKIDNSSRIRRRSSQSSSSSDQSTYNSSEVGSSPKSNERTDSEFEQDALTHHDSLSVSTSNMLIKPLCKEALPKTINLEKEFSNATKKFGSAKFLLATSKVYQTKLSVSANFEEEYKLKRNDDHKNLDYDCSEKGSHGQFIKKGESKDETEKTLSQNHYSRDVALNESNASQQFPTFHKDPVDFQEKKGNSSTSLKSDLYNSAVNINYSDPNIAYIKESLHNDHKGFPMSGGCYNANRTDIVSSRKNPDLYASDGQHFPEHTELPSIYDSNLFDKTSNLETPKTGHMYMHQSSHHSNNDTFESHENKVSSTLTFDSSSLFADLPISEFESHLYGEDPNTKGNYIDFTCSDNEQYPQFVQEKSWVLTEEASDMLLPNGIAPFQVIGSRDSEKYPEGTQTSRPMSLSLSETITDFNTGFINSISEDELEIKRLVTELESQLQTSKLNNEASSKSCLKNPVSLELSDSSILYSGIVVNSVETCIESVHFKETHADQINCSRPTLSVETSIEDCQLKEIKDKPDHSKNWSCPIEFDTFNSSIQSETPSKAQGNIVCTDNNNQYKDLSAGLQEEMNCLPNNHLSTSTILDVSLNNAQSRKDQDFSEKELMVKSMPIVEIMLCNNAEIKVNSDIPNNSGDEILNKDKTEDSFEDPPELEPFHSGLELNSEFDLQDSVAPVLCITNNPLQTEILSKDKLENSFFGTDLAASTSGLECGEEGTVCGKDQSPDSTNHSEQINNAVASYSNTRVLDMPVLVKEESVINEKLPAVQESADNPLQQLQLFVARTAKTNEEEMLMPCFPVLLTTPSHIGTQSEIDSDPLYVTENRLSDSTEVSKNYIATAEQLDVTSNLSETSKHTAVEQPHALQSEDTCSALLYGSLSSEIPDDKTKDKTCHQLEKNCQEADVMDVERKCMTQSIANDNQLTAPNKEDGQNQSNGNNVALNIKQRDTVTFSLIPEPSSPQPSAFELPFIINPHVNELCKDTKDVAEEKDILVEINKINEETITEFKGESEVEPSDQFSLQDSGLNALQQHSLDYHTQNHGINKPTVNSQLSYETFPHLPEDSSGPEQMVFPSVNSLSCSKEDATSQSITMGELGGGTQKINKIGTSTIEEPNALIYESENNYGTPSLKMCQAQHKSPTSKDNMSTCFCSELLCPNYKGQTNKDADLFLRCNSLPPNEVFPVYAGTDSHRFSAHQTELFSEDVDIINVSSLCDQKDERLHCNWSENAENRHMNYELSIVDRAPDLTCNIMDIVESDFEDFSNPTVSTTKHVQHVQSTQNIAVGKKTTAVDPICKNDMDSVILRILDCDKSKELLESIGIQSKNSLLKEKKPIGQSLTCNICSVSFKSKTGLTRHKSVKHNNKNEGSLMQKDVSISESEEKNSITHGEVKEPLGQDHIHATHLASGEQQSSISSGPKGDKKMKGQFDSPHSEEVEFKKKLTNKIKKRKTKQSLNKNTDSQVPSDDELNMLKTNILKAIGQTSSFTTTEDINAWNQPSKHEKPQIENDRESSLTESITDKTFVGKDETKTKNGLDLKINDTSVANEEILEQNNVHDSKCTKIQLNEQFPKPDLETDLENIKETDITKKEQPDCYESKKAEQNLHSLFDDDTFSQLFPRDDHFIRRKCTRVYGKKAKRQTLPFDPDIPNLDPTESCHSSQGTNYTCTYRDIPIDSAQICNTSTTSKVEPYTKPIVIKKGTDMDENGILPISPLVENVHLPLIIGESQKATEENVCFKDSLDNTADASEDSVETNRDSELEQGKMTNDTSITEFPTINMKMLSAKFDMRELSFFSACGDDSDRSDLDTQDVTPRGDQHKKNTKTKSSDKKQSRNRNSVNIKKKDKQYKCKVCFQWFLTLGELDFHKLTHNPSPPPTCYMCVQRKFSSREQLRDHLKDKHAKNKAGLWICGMCLKEISDVWMYNEHLREHATQFARKGQAQKTVMGIPGCFAEDSMVRTFLSTFIYRTPSKPKTPENEDKSPTIKKQTHIEHKEEDEQVTDKEPVRSTQNVSPTPVHVKLSVSTSLEMTQKCDIAQKNVSIHPHCKDPSRDCHHCGKQFPKPFKLQRHLVVHSLQKMYLCHRCPNSYQEVQDLRSHLNNTHKLGEEAIEIKHTTLYACELCADVMHVIKKSFICSTCNYTFSKKEQYDRHMEKHLIGGTMVFKFRGVMRPGTLAKDLREKRKESISNESSQPNKKQKTSIRNQSHTINVLPCSNDRTSICQSHCGEFVSSSGLMLDNKLNLKTVAETGIEVKTEDMLVDIQEVNEENTKNEVFTNSALCIPPIAHNELKSDENTKKVISDLIIKEMDTEIVSEPEYNVNEPSILYPTKAKHTKINPISSSKQGDEVANMPEIVSSQVDDDDVHCHLLPKESSQLFASNKDVSSTDFESSQSEETKIDKEDNMQPVLTESTDISSLLPKENAMVPDVNSYFKEPRGLKRSRSINHHSGRSTSKVTTICDGVEVKGVIKPCTTKAKNTSETCSVAKKESGKSDKMSANVTKIHSKTRKEPKIYGAKGSSASRENISGEGKAKKTKLIGTGKTEASGYLKNSQSSFTEIKDEYLSGRHYPKPNSVITSNQIKKTVLDSHNQRKQNSRPTSGEYKCKNALLAKTLHPLTPKSSTSSLNGISQKHRLGQNTKPTEPLNYRTAESQNNLLSQLFGQKLTSFKIPLKREVTE